MSTCQRRRHVNNNKSGMTRVRECRPILINVNWLISGRGNSATIGESVFISRLNYFFFFSFARFFNERQTITCPETISSSAIICWICHARSLNFYITEFFKYITVRFIRVIGEKIDFVSFFFLFLKGEFLCPSHFPLEIASIRYFAQSLAICRHFCSCIQYWILWKLYAIFDAARKKRHYWCIRCV